MKNTDAKIFDILLAYELLREESADMSDISRAFSWLSQADAAKRAGDTRKFASLLRSAASSLGKAANAAEKQFEDELARLERKEIKKLYEEINGMGLLEECIKETVEKIERRDGGGRQVCKQALCKVCENESRFRTFARSKRNNKGCH